ncbi:MAG: Ig-like domain-containing protein [Gammaproteobacteria bacterium]|nr:Ig-like domain-containing protein [Gammaproteobacteria bacterium]
MPATEGVLVNDTDPDGADDQMSVVGVAGQASFVGATLVLENGSVIGINANGSYGFDPAGALDALAAGETTTSSISYVVEDADGGQDRGLLTVTVEGVDDAPVPQPDSGTTTGERHDLPKLAG